jgi:hypothetical protein
VSPNVEDDVGRMDALGERLNASRLDSGESVGETAARILTICRSLSLERASLRHMRSSAAGNTQSLNGARLREAPGCAPTGT